MDRETIGAWSDKLTPDLYRFLRDIVAIPSESGQETRVIHRIAEEMYRVGFDNVETDPMGNLLGRIGTGQRIIAFDAHVDTVGVGDPDLWDTDPFEGFEDEKRIGGRGSSDQKGGIAAMVYAGRIMKEIGIPEDLTVLMVGSVQEEDCEGLCWQYIIEEDGIRPDFVLSTEPSSCTVCRGQRGRMEIRVATAGLSCHGSAPERGRTPSSRWRPFSAISRIFLVISVSMSSWSGTLTVSEIFFTSPSRCAVADSCAVSIDRRLTLGESAETAIHQIESLPSVKGSAATVKMYKYETPSHTGLEYPTESYFPPWLLKEEHPAVQLVADSYSETFGRKPVIDRWTFSTNGVSITGKFGIPTVGFGPGHEDQAHAPNEHTLKEELRAACRLYAAVPGMWQNRREDLIAR